MGKERGQRIFVEGVSAFFILLFVYTAISKLLEPQSFTGAISKTPVIEMVPVLFDYTILATHLMIARLCVFPQTMNTGLISSPRNQLNRMEERTCNLISFV